MPDSNIPINAPTTPGQDIASFQDALGNEHEKTLLEYIDGTGQPAKVSTTTPLPVTDADALAALLSIAGEDFATQTTLAALLAKVIAAPSTEAKQDAMIGLLTTIAAITQPLTNTQLRAVPVPISGTVTVTGAGDATAANQTSQITQEIAINTVMGLVADAIVAAGATGSISAKLRRATQGLEDLKTAIVLAAGANIIGKVGIDQTTPGTTNLVALTAETTKIIGAVNQATISTATLSNVTGSATSVTLSASNASRRQLMIFNDSTVNLYVKFGATASTTSFTVLLIAGAYYELPQPVYTGIIDGIWSSATGSARITVLT